MTEQIILQEEKNKDWRLLEFFMPIQEAIENEKEFIIRGVAINETTTLNNVKYVAEELEKAAATFRNVPILLDHVNEVKSIVGRTTHNVNWNPINRRVDFEGKIMDKDIQEMIRDGRIGSVSIGARVQDLTEEEDGSMKAIGVHGLELSLVAVPGDSHANFGQALQHSFVLKEKLNAKQDIAQKEVKQMAEEQEKPVEEPVAAPEEVKSEEPAEKPAEEAPAEVAEEKVSLKEINEQIKKQMEELSKKQIEVMKEMLKENKKEIVKEDKKIKEEAEVEVEDETKGEVSNEEEVAEEKTTNVVVEKSRDGYALYRDYKQEGSESSLKRLVR